MDQSATWQVIEAERTLLADLLDTLTDEQWATPSLCAGWTVRDTAAHVSSGSRMGLRDVLVEAVRARGSFDRMVDTTARRDSVRPTAELVADLRTAAGSRHLAPGQSLGNALLDILVHTQDIGIPLGIDHTMPRDAARRCADDTWRHSFPFRARRRLRGLRLTATDTDWSAGEGTEVEGPIAALLLLVTGRYAALDRLTGPGAAELVDRLSPTTP